jgi:uncharacterized GH25 family protein
MKIILLTLLFSLNASAHNHEIHKEKEISAGESLHQEECLTCHIAEHNQDFYTRKERKITNLFALKRQVSGCAQAFDVDWFPDEENSVTDYLNQEFYQFQ